MISANDDQRALHVDLFCQVIDNYGDAGVCWRLARQMVAERRWRVRLFIDRLDVLAQIAVCVSPSLAEQVLNGVRIHQWPHQAPASLGDVVIEAFGCRLPDTILDAMARRKRPPVWINLEYLSAEAWIEGCHGLPSPDPRRPLTKYFYFPGFTPQTGGLLCERDYDERRAAFMRAKQTETFLAGLGVPPDRCHQATLTSLFCYADSPITDLASAWRDAAHPVICLLPIGAPQSVTDALGVRDAVGESKRIGQLTTVVIPFLDPADYDRLLCACDVNFVRGEDSFLRAQWACRPTIWQPYRQADAHHVVKLVAFLDRYLAALPDPAAAALRQLSMAWSPGFAGDVTPPLGSCWNDLVATIRNGKKLNAGLETWRQSIRSGGNLLDRMAIFVRNQLK